jgi:hypothetical protein
MSAHLIWFSVSAIRKFTGVKYHNNKRLDEFIVCLFVCLLRETDKKVDAVNGTCVTC